MEESESHPHTSMSQQSLKNGFTSTKLNKNDEFYKPLNRRNSRVVRNKRDEHMVYEGDDEWDRMLKIEISGQSNPEKGRMIRARTGLSNVNPIEEKHSPAEIAAVSSGLRFCIPEIIERIKFRELFQKNEDIARYLHCRNQILALWQENTSKTLSFSECQARLGLSFDTILRPIFDFLNQHALINFGFTEMECEYLSNSTNGNSDLEEVINYETNIHQYREDTENGLNIQMKDEEKDSSNKNHSLYQNSVENVHLCASINNTACYSEVNTKIEEEGKGSVIMEKETVFENLNIVIIKNASSVNEIIEQKHDSLFSSNKESELLELSERNTSSSSSMKVMDETFSESMNQNNARFIDSVTEKDEKNRHEGFFSEEKKGNSIDFFSEKRNEGVKEEEKEDEEMVNASKGNKHLNSNSNSEVKIFSKTKPMEKGSNLVKSKFAENVKKIGNQSLSSDSNSSMDSKRRKKIIIIGAGASGLSAAKNLTKLNFDVTVLEARDRVGGRVNTDKQTFSAPVDLGASIITGVHADVVLEKRPDPSALMCRQLKIDFLPLRGDCPLYDSHTGEKVMAEIDAEIEKEYNALLDESVNMVLEKGESAEMISLGEALEEALLKRRRCRERESEEGKGENAVKGGNGEKERERGIQNGVVTSFSKKKIGMKKEREEEKEEKEKDGEGLLGEEKFNHREINGNKEKDNELLQEGTRVKEGEEGKSSDFMDAKNEFVNKVELGEEGCSDKSKFEFERKTSSYFHGERSESNRDGYNSLSITNGSIENNKDGVDDENKDSENEEDDNKVDVNKDEEDKDHDNHKSCMQIMEEEKANGDDDDDDNPIANSLKNNDINNDKSNNSSSDTVHSNDQTASMNAFEKDEGETETETDKKVVCLFPPETSHLLASGTASETKQKSTEETKPKEGKGEEMQFMNENDYEKEHSLERRVLDWHFANLEYGCASTLDNVSLPHWNQDDVYGGFGGDHCMVKGGYGQLLDCMAKNLDVRLNCIITKIEYGEGEGEGEKEGEGGDVEKSVIEEEDRLGVDSESSEVKMDEGKSKLGKEESNGRFDGGLENDGDRIDEFYVNRDACKRMNHMDGDVNSITHIKKEKMTYGDNDIHNNYDNNTEFMKSVLIKRNGQNDTSKDQIHENQNNINNTNGVNESINQKKKKKANNQVKIHTSKGEVFECDAVLVTIPLGCLKNNDILFSPPLPPFKSSSIKKLGFGVLNKLVMQFSHVFWDKNVDFFGVTGGNTASRGKFFMFWNLERVCGHPILTSLLVGESAGLVSSQEKEGLVSEAVLVLRKLFGEENVPEPVASSVTDWKADPFSRGAYSFVAVGASGNDYYNLSIPVSKKVYFAGEATCREHPDTVGGAMLSGIRESIRIFNHFNSQIDVFEEEKKEEKLLSFERLSEIEENDVALIKKKLEEGGWILGFGFRNAWEEASWKEKVDRRRLLDDSEEEGARKRMRVEEKKRGIGKVDVEEMKNVFVQDGKGYEQDRKGLEKDAKMLGKKLSQENSKAFLMNLFQNAKTFSGKILLSKEVLVLPYKKMVSIFGNFQMLSCLNAWIEDSLNKDDMQLLQLSLKIVLISTNDLSLVKSTGIGKTVKQRVCAVKHRGVKMIVKDLIKKWMFLFKQKQQHSEIKQKQKPKHKQMSKTEKINNKNDANSSEKSNRNKFRSDAIKVKNEQRISSVKKPEKSTPVSDRKLNGNSKSNSSFQNGMVETNHVHEFIDGNDGNNNTNNNSISNSNVKDGRVNNSKKMNKFDNRPELRNGVEKDEKEVKDEEREREREEEKEEKERKRSQAEIDALRIANELAIAAKNAENALAEEIEKNKNMFQLPTLLSFSAFSKKTFKRQRMETETEMEKNMAREKERSKARSKERKRREEETKLRKKRNKDKRNDGFEEKEKEDEKEEEEEEGEEHHSLKKKAKLSPFKIENENEDSNENENETLILNDDLSGKSHGQQEKRDTEEEEEKVPNGKEDEQSLANEDRNRNKNAGNEAGAFVSIRKRKLSEEGEGKGQNQSEGREGREKKGESFDSKPAPVDVYQETFFENVEIFAKEDTSVLASESQQVRKVKKVKFEEKVEVRAFVSYQHDGEKEKTVARENGRLSGNCGNEREGEGEGEGKGKGEEGEGSEEEHVKERKERELFCDRISESMDANEAGLKKEKEKGKREKEEVEEGKGTEKEKDKKYSIQLKKKKKMVGDYVMQLLIPLLKRKRIDRVGFKEIARKTTEKVIEHDSMREKDIEPDDFLIPKRKERIRSLMEKYVKKYANED